MIKIMRSFGIDAGHRLWKHEGKCKHLHGHRYTFEVWCESSGLDNLGRVIDFSVIKNKIGGWLENNFDHGMILNENDPYVLAFQNIPFEDQKIFLLPFNPTAENLAQYLIKVANEIMEGTGIFIKKVGVWETPNCYAEVVN